MRSEAKEYVNVEQVGFSRKGVYDGYSDETLPRRDLSTGAYTLVYETAITRCYMGW
jgi:hypothetical protein